MKKALKTETKVTGLKAFFFNSLFYRMGAYDCFHISSFHDFFIFFLFLVKCFSCIRLLVFNEFNYLSQN
jgi:hypothetical protein